MSLDRENGRLYLLGEKDWVFNALEVLHSYGFIRTPFFVYPRNPVDAHIKIVIVVGLRMDAEEFKKKFSQQTNAEFNMFDEELDDTSDDEEEIKPSKTSKSLAKKYLKNLVRFTFIVINIATFGALSFYGYKSMSK